MFEIITSVIMLVPTGETADNGKELFNLFIDDKVIIYVYKEEVKEYFKTGIFKYNEDLVFETKGD
jgi:hypothetical protein